MDKSHTPLVQKKIGRASRAKKKKIKKIKFRTEVFGDIEGNVHFFLTPWWSENFEKIYFMIFLKCFDFLNCIECFKNMKTLEKLAARFRETEQTKETRTTKQNEQTGGTRLGYWLFE